MTQEPTAEADRELDRATADGPLAALGKLVEEIVDDNMAVVATLTRLDQAQQGLATDVAQGFAALRKDLAGALTYRALKDLCIELVGPLTAMEAMLARADFADPAAVAQHVRSLSLTLRGVLARMGAERVTVAVGEELYDPNRHRCVGVVDPADSPFPDAAPHTVVRVVEDGYVLDRRPLNPPTVEIQASRAAPAASAAPAATEVPANE
jgi:molecular chaperone GrpE (heat shock protein)